MRINIEQSEVVIKKTKTMLNFLVENERKILFLSEFLG